MLTLTRRLNERIFIICPDGTEIVIDVREIRHDLVRLSLDAPASYAIDREEVRKSKLAGPKPQDGEGPK